MQSLRAALKNEYVKSLILMIIVLLSIVGFWLGLRAYLRTEYPLLAVASGSMIPTLNVGDLIIVQGGLNVSDIVAENGTGDIVVFHQPTRPSELIVHRAVEKLQDADGWYLKTKGDYNHSPDNWKVYDDDLVGKVVSSIPYIGNIPLFVHTTTGMTIIVILIVILILLEFVLPFVKERKEPEPREEDANPESDSL